MTMNPKNLDSREMRDVFPSHSLCARFYESYRAGFLFFSISTKHARSGINLSYVTSVKGIIMGIPVKFEKSAQ